MKFIKWFTFVIATAASMAAVVYAILYRMEACADIVETVSRKGKGLLLTVEDRIAKLFDRFLTEEDFIDAEITLDDEE